MDTKALRRLQLDFSRLRERVDSLEHENSSLRAALEDSGVLKFEESFFAAIHRRKFAAVRQRHPCSFEMTLGNVLMKQALSNAIADCLQEAPVRAVRAPCADGSDQADAKEKILSLAPGEGDSTIYIFGGNDDAKTLNSCERYCPATNEWEPLPAMHQARSAAAACYHNGLLYVVGGNFAGQTLAHMECYDPVKETWEIMPTLIRSRSACTVASLLGKIYVCGGWSGKQALASCERYEPKTRSWEQLTPMANRREWPVITVDDGQLYLCGGQDGSEDVSVVEAFDPKRMGWETLPLKVQCRRNAAIAVVQSQLYMFGGHGTDGRHVLNTVERFIPQSGNWEGLAPMQTHRRNSMAIVIAGRIYVCGGRGSRGNHNHGGGHALRTAERYDPVTGEWENVPGMIARRYRAATIVAPNTQPNQV